VKSIIRLGAYAVFTTVSASGSFAQSPPARPIFDAFEVATIKPSNPDAPICGVCMQGAHRFLISGTLKQLMVWAYNTTPGLVSAGPGWSGSDRYDLVAEAPNEIRPTQQENMVMLQKLLADPFKLVVHREPKVLSIFELVVGKNGPKLRPTATPENDPLFTGENFTIVYRAFPMARLAAMLQRGVGPVDRPVVDKTGLPGKFDFELEFDYRQPKPEDSDKPDLFTAIQQQLGLKLEPTRGTVDGIVIDKAEHPTEN
jgi:uncharacterized protein (TIGR03435 family)